MKLDRHRRALAAEPRLIEQAIECVALAAQRYAAMQPLSGLQHDGASLHAPATGIRDGAATLGPRLGPRPVGLEVQRHLRGGRTAVIAEVLDGRALPLARH